MTSRIPATCGYVSSARRIRTPGSPPSTRARRRRCRECWPCTTAKTWQPPAPLCRWAQGERWTTRAQWRLNNWKRVRYCSVNDVGRVINPLIVIGQFDGGALQGIGQAQLEQVVYDPESGQLLTGSLMDYAVPYAYQAPEFRTRMDESTPCLNNPLGVKGVASSVPSVPPPAW